MDEETETNLGDSSGVEGHDDDTDHDFSDGGALDGGDEGEGEDSSSPPADDEEEVEHNGKKYRIPKAINAERLMQSDYTRKTTELADQRRAFEADRAAWKQAEDDLVEARGAVHSIKAQLAEYDSIDWQTVNAENAGLAQTLWMQREQLKDALGKAEGTLQQKTNERLNGQREGLAKAMQETGRVLARDIKDWSPTLANKIADYGIKNFGVTADEVREMADPRLWKVLHRAMTAEGELEKVRKGQRQAKLQETTPAQNVSAKAKAPATGLSDDLPMDEWLKRRNEQQARRNRR